MMGYESNPSWRGVSTWVESLTGEHYGLLGPLLDTLVVVLIALLLRRWLTRALTRNIEDPARRYMLAKVIGYAIGVVAVTLVVQVWISDAVDLTTYLGFLSAGLAVALKDPILNLAGWLFIMVRQPFRVGDRIEIGDAAGDVVDIGPLTFSLLEIGNWVPADQSTGRLMHLPSGMVFTRRIANYTQGFEYIWNELAVVVTFESDWQQAREILDAIVTDLSKEAVAEAEAQIRRTAQKYMVHYKHLTPIVWVSVVDIGVQLDVRYLCHARARRSTADAMWRRILIDFAKAPRIDFAYPTQRWYQHAREGKPDMRPPALFDAPAA